MSREEVKRRIGRRGALKGLGAGLAAIGWVDPLAAARTSPGPPLRIGLLLPMSGPSRRLGADVAAGFALAMAEIDERAVGRPLEVRSRDAGGERDEVLVTARRLIEEDGVDILVAAGGSRPSDGLRAAAEAAKVPLLLAAAPAAAADRCSPWTLSLTCPLERMAAAAGRWLPANTRLKRVYVLAVDSATARQGVEAFGRSLAENGGELVGQELVPERSRELAPYLAKVRLVAPEGLLAIFHGEMATDLEQALAGSGLRQRTRPVALGWLPSLRAPDSQAKDAPPGWLGLSDFLPEVGHFVRDFEGTFGRPPAADAARGYDAGLLIEAALEATGGRTDNRLVFREALRRARFSGARGPVEVDPATGALRHGLTVFETIGGESGAAYRPIDMVAPAGAPSCSEA